MADNVSLPAATGKAASDEVTYSGDTNAQVQLMRLVQTTGAEGSKTVVDLPGDATNGLDVDVTRLPALAAGTNNIGDVDVLTLPALPAGTNNIGDVDVLTLPGTAAEAAALPGVFMVCAGDDGTDTQPLQLSASGDLKITLDSETVGLAAGTNNIGDVDVLTLPALPAGTNNIGDVDVLTLPALPAGTNNIGDVDVLTMPATQTFGAFATCSTDITRPGNTTTYTSGNALSDSTTAPTTGGFTFTGAARQSGGSGIITDMIVTSSNDPALLLQGEIWIFDQAVTNINDNAAFAVSDTEIKTCVAKVPFTLEDAGNNGFYHVQNLSIGYTCNGSANLRFLVKVKNAYIPANAEVITVVAKCLQVT